MRAAKKEVAIYLKVVNQMRSGLRSAEMSLRGFRDRANRMMKQLATIATTAFIGAATAATLVGANFEQSLANVGAVARATEIEMAALEDRARSLGSTTAFSAGQAAEAMYSLSSGGLDVSQTIAATEGVLKLAGATMTDMGMSAELTMAAMRQFGLQAEDTERIVNVFAAGIQNSMLNMQRLSDSMIYAAPIASALGMSIEETVGAMGLLVNSGLRASQAGTGFRMSMIGLLKPNKELQQLLGGVSLEVDGLTAVLDKLAEAELGATQYAALFDSRSLAVMKTLIEEREELGRLTEAVTGTQAAFEMYDRQMATTQSKMKILKSALEELGITIFQAIKPQLDRTIVAITDWVNENSARIGELVRRIMVYIGQAMGALGNFYNFIKRNEVIIATMIQGLGIAGGAIYALATAVTVLNVAMTANPIMAVTKAVILLIGALSLWAGSIGGWEVAWLRVQSTVKTVGFAIRNFGEKVWADIQYVGDVFVTLGKTVWVVLTGIWEVMQDWGAKVGDFFAMIGKSILQPWKADEFWNEWATNLEGGIASLAERIGPKIVGMWEDIAELRNQRYKEADDKWRADHQELLDWYAESLANIKPPTLPAILPEAPPKMEDFGEATVQEEMAQARELLAQTARARDQYRDTTKDVFLATGYWVEETNAKIADSSIDTFKVMKNAGQSAASGITSAIGNMVFESGKLLKNLGNIAKSVFSSILGGFLRIGVGMLFPAAPAAAAIPAQYGASAVPNQMYLVGEGGPELFIPTQSGRISPIPALGASKQESATYNITVPVNITEGSLLVAEDNMSVIRMADTIWNVIDTRIKGSYHEGS